ncbi:MAG: DUF1292 domain-containing protein [Lachnospiraceae bacterium]|nr:DUF1292 domain-containing protein [Lachnospiraceae bacterium]
MNNEEYITFLTADNEEVSLKVIEQTMVNNTNYLLVAASDEDEADAMILKEISENGDDVCYEEIDDDIEYEAIAKVFGELLEDYDIDLE